MLIDLAKLVTDIKQRDLAVHAFVEYCEDKEPNTSVGGRLQPKLLGSALLDWTFAIKSNIAVSGLAHSAGIGAYRNRVATADAFCVKRLREACAEIIGSVNMEEAALGATNDNPHFGKTFNPRRANHTPGGSSGGSAAAVAAGMVRVALGTDTMGSCRIPAAYCGVYGFKPSYGRISMRGVEPLARRLDHVGILANSVEDVERSFGVLDFYDADDPGAHLYNAPGMRNVTSLATLAVLDQPSRAGLSAEVCTAYTKAIERLENAGHWILEKPLAQSGLAAARRAGLLICEVELGQTLRSLVDRDDPGLSPWLKKMIAFGAGKSPADLAAAHAAVDATKAILDKQMTDVDALFWPTAPQTAFAFGEPVPANQADFTCLANFTGAPAISLPLAVGEQQLPVGGQLMMPLGYDIRLLRLAETVAAAVQS
jgi:Asp-tRNA(Asn)/Glu-tRNA(Gln) amidotransferase A subunit family amidase